MPEVTKASFWTENPSEEKRLKQYFYESLDEAQAKVEKAHQAFRKTAISTPLSERKKWIVKVSNALAQNREKLASLMTAEMGKPLKESLVEIDKCINLCEVFVDQCEEWLKSEIVNDQYRVVRHPYGVVLGIMPWNFPFWQVFRYSVPALLSGNSVLLKHSDQVAGCAGLLEEIFHGALSGSDLFQNLVVNHEIAEHIIQSPSVSMVSFTGSTAAGSRIASLCGASLKKCILELGGNDAYVVSQTADLVRSAKACAAARLVNNGQSCVAAKRFLVHETIISEFLQLMRKEFESYQMGSPQDPRTDLGPLSARRFQIQIEKQCRDLEAQGYEKVFQHQGFKTSGDGGCFFPPRIYLGKNARQFYDEEIFGPVAVFYPYRTWNDVEHFATESQYGLGSALFSQDQGELARFVQFSESGFIGLNEPVRSSPSVPFGGFKKSGFGRELGRAGFLEFTQTKTVSGKGLKTE